MCEITEVASIEGGGAGLGRVCDGQGDADEGAGVEGRGDSGEQKSGGRGVAARSAGVVGGGCALCVCGGRAAAAGAWV